MFGKRKLFKARFLEREDVADQRQLDQQHHIMDWTWHETTARQGTRQSSMEKAGS